MVRRAARPPLPIPAALALLVLAACRPLATVTPRDCAAAYAALPAPRPPLVLPPIVPIAIGDALPVVRVAAPQEDATSLATRAFALACVLAEDAVMATPELPRWAAASVSGAPLTDVGPQFDAAVGAYRMWGEGGFPALEVWSLRAPRSPVPRAGELDEGIGRGAAQAVADAALARIVARGLATSAEHPLSHVSRQVTHRCDEGKPCSRHVARYVFDYDAHLGGVAVGGSGVRIDVDREGALVRLSVRVVELEQVGTVVAATDGPTADARLLALARARWPTQEIRVHTPGSVVFPSRSHVDAAGVAPVWRASWVTHSRRGMGSRRQIGWLALDRADAPLLLEP